MKKVIVLTSINSPTKATLKFCEIAKKKNWTLIIVGDLKTPHSEYQKLENENVIYLTPERQQELYPELSDSIGWNKCQRRNIAFVYAYDNGCEILATSDDDNIPYDNWGDQIFVGQEIEIDNYEHVSGIAFDPISATEHKHLWHRGYPIELVPTKNNIEYKGKIKRKVLVQADFWDGDPDIDSICRLTHKPIVKFNTFNPFGSTQIAPFNSQNTFLSREVLPYYVVFPHLGRMDDIWGAYVLQYFFPESVIYNKATVYQDRNVHNLVNNMIDEIVGYKNTFHLINDLENFLNYLPDEVVNFWNVYRKQFTK